MRDLSLEECEIVTGGYDPYAGTEVEEIVIVGYAPPALLVPTPPIDPPVLNQPVYGDGSGMGSGGGPTYAQLVTKWEGHVTTQIENAANTTTVNNAKEEIAKEMARLEPLVHALDPAGRTILQDGRIVNNSELQTIFDNMQFVVTDHDFGPNRAGAVAPDGTAYKDQFNAANLMGYAAPGYTQNEGMNYILLHELAHLTQAGQTVHNTEASDYVTRTHDSGFTNYSSGSGSPEFVANEVWANDAAKSLATTLGVPVAGTVTHGY